MVLYLSNAPLRKQRILFFVFALFYLFYFILFIYLFIYYYYYHHYYYYFIIIIIIIIITIIVIIILLKSHFKVFQCPFQMLSLHSIYRKDNLHIRKIITQEGVQGKAYILNLAHFHKKKHDRMPKHTKAAFWIPTALLKF